MTNTQLFIRKLLLWIARVNCDKVSTCFLYCVSLKALSKKYSWQLLHLRLRAGNIGKLSWKMALKLHMDSRVNSRKRTKVLIRSHYPSRITRLRHLVKIPMKGTPLLKNVFTFTAFSRLSQRVLQCLMIFNCLVSVNS